MARVHDKARTHTHTRYLELMMVENCPSTSANSQGVTILHKEILRVHSGHKNIFSA